MQISVDPVVVALQVVPFLLTMIALHFIIFKPMLAYLDQREQARVAGRDEALALQAGIEEKLAQIESRMSQAHSEVVDLKSERRTKALAEAEARQEQGRHQANQRLDAAKDELGQDRLAASATLREAARELGDDIAGRVLGRDLKAG